MGKPFHCGISIDNFEPEEFFCPCCGKERMHPDTLIKIEAWRKDYGKRISVALGGGYRCIDYAGSKTSAHHEGRAIDPLYPREDHDTLLGLGYKHGFTGKGDKNAKDKDGIHRWQLHLDDCFEIPGIRPRPWKWTYNS